MPALDIFRNDAFTLRELTAAVNHMPYIPGKVGKLGLFTESGTSTPYVMIEEKSGVLSLVSSQPRGGAKNQNKTSSRKMRSLNIPHLPIEDQIKADELSGVRVFGSNDELVVAQGVTNERLAEMVVKLDVTVEHLRLGAIKGQILDADLSVIYDLFAEFNVSQAAEIDFDLDNVDPTPGVLKKKFNKVIRLVEDGLGDSGIYDHVHAFAGSAWIDDFTSHREVTESVKYQQSQFLRESQVNRTITWGDIVIEEYRGSVGGVDFIDANAVHFFPVGAPGLFLQKNAPAPFMETVNTIGLPRYAKVAPDQKYEEYVDVFVQANPLPFCTKPRALVKGKRT